MFNPEKLLGGLVCGGLRRKRGLAALNTNGALGGLIGVAVESVKNFQCGESAKPAVAAEEDSRGPALATQTAAILLIRAMVAAAYAGGPMDAAERTVIFDKLKALDLSEEEEEFVSSELLAAKNCKSLATAANSPEMARQVYLASILAVDMDTEAQRIHMKELSGALALDPADVSRMHREVDLPLPV